MTKGQASQTRWLACALALACATASTSCSKKNPGTISDAAAPQATTTKLSGTTVLAHDLELKGVGRLVATDDAVFFTTGAGLLKVPCRGGATTTALPYHGTVWSVTIDHGVAVMDEDVAGGGAALTAFPLSGGTQPVALCAGTAAGDIPTTEEKPSFVVDANSVYWRKIDNIDFLRPDAANTNLTTIYRCPRGGGPPAVVAKKVKAGTHGALAVGGRQLLFGSIATLYSVSLDDGSVKTLVPGYTDNVMTSIVVDGEYAYFALGGTPMRGSTYNRYKDGAVKRVRLAGGDVEDLALDQMWPDHLVVDDTSVYWTTRDDHAYAVEPGDRDDRIKRGKKSGGEVKVVETAEAAALAVNKDNVYWLVKGTAQNAYRDGQLVGTSK